MTTTFPPVPRNLSGFLQLGTWLGKLETWAKALLERVRSLDEAEVVTFAGPGTFTMTTENVVEFIGGTGCTIVAPAADVIPGRRSRPRVIINNGTGIVTIAPAASGTIDGSTTGITLSTGRMMLLAPNGQTKTITALRDIVVSPSILIGANPTPGAGGSTGRVVIGDNCRAGPGPNVAIGNAAWAVAQHAVAIGPSSQALQEGTCVGDSARILGNAAGSVCVGYQAQVGLTDAGAANDGSICVGVRARIPHDTTRDAVVIGADANASVGDGQTVIGRSASATHGEVVLLGHSSVSDRANKLRIRVNGTYVIEAVDDPASGSTGMSLVCNVGAGVVVLPVTLAASVGGQRALQVAG